MPPVRPFLTSLYLSLGLSILAIGVAGGDLLPELPFVTAFCLLLLIGAYVIEGRWELSLRAANMVGLGLAAFLGLWAIFQIVRPPTGLSDMLPWPASALPYLAPVLMILIPAKLLRPKHIGDFWTMQGLGLLAMALACALAMEGMFILVFMAYAITFIWSLTTFHLYRELGPELSQRPMAAGRWKAIRPAIIWAAITGAAAVPMFWATPRTGSQWELAINTRGRATTGLSEGPVDLNRTGQVAVNSEPAFEVFAFDRSGQPYLELPADQRFRSLVLHNYDGGRWVRNQSSMQVVDRSFSVGDLTRNPYSRLPDLGPQTIYLNFALQPRLARMAPLADPIAWRAGQHTPVLSKYQNETYRNWIHKNDGLLDGSFDIDSSAPQHVQAWTAPESPGMGRVMRINSSLRNLDYLTRQPRGLNRLKAFTDQLIERLVAQGALPSEVLTTINASTQFPSPEYHLAIARALEQHLSASGEYSYTLDLTRQDKTIDPTEDFLLNTKSGHCQRFATALVLMLRSQGIPSQMVIGYRGCESRGDGWYDVREDQAHAWVEILVAAPEVKRPHGAPWDHALSGDAIAPTAALTGAIGASWLTYDKQWQPVRWVTLDPTPVSPGGDEGGAANFLEQARQKWESVLKALLLAYNQESRDQAVTASQEWVVDDGGWLYLICAAAMLAGLVILRRRARKRAALFSEFPQYGRRAGYPQNMRRMTLALMRAGHIWQPSQTAREFAADVSRALAAQSRTAAVAQVPTRVVDAYYAYRFGDRAIDSQTAIALDTEVKRLESALR